MMKEHELRKHANCSVCGNKILASGLPLFWRVTVERFCVDLRALSRQQGLTMLLNGRAAIAAAMGPDEDMAQPAMEPTIITMCEKCAMEETCIAFLAELHQADPVPEEDK